MYFSLWLDYSEVFPTFLCPVNSLPSLNLNSKNAFLRETFSDSSWEIRSPATHLEAHSLCSPLTTSLHSGSPVDSEMERQERPWQHLEGVQSILTDVMSEHTQFRSHFSISSCLSSSLQLLYHIPHLSFFVPTCFLGSEEVKSCLYCESLPEFPSFQNSLYSFPFHSDQLTPYSHYTI